MTRYACILMRGDKVTRNAVVYTKEEIDKMKPQNNIPVTFEDSDKVIGRAETFTKLGNLIASIEFNRANFEISETACFLPEFLAKDADSTVDAIFPKGLTLEKVHYFRARNMATQDYPSMRPTKERERMRIVK